MRLLLALLLAVWPLLVAAQLPFLVNSVVRFWATRTWHRLDREHPDDLPLPAGEWLAARLAALHSPFDAIAVDDSRDHCDYERKLIVLRGRTYFKADPAFWAIAAHELGHARIELEHRGMRAVVDGARLLRYLALVVGAACALGAVLYQLPVARDVALYAFGAAIALSVVKLVDELLASGLAMAELRAAGLDRRRLRAARTTLAAAFMTYVSLFVVELALLAWWPIATLDLSHPPMALTAFGAALAAAAAALVVLRLAAELVLQLAPRILLPVLPFLDRWIAVPMVLYFLSSLGPVGFLLLVWDTTAASAAPWLAILAFVSMWRPLHAALVLPLRLPASWFAGLLRRVEGDVHWTDEYVRARRRGGALLAAGAARFKRPAARHGLATWRYRLGLAIQLLVLPLVIAFWLA